MGETRLLALE